MAYKFKYHPDGQILRSGQFPKPYATFITENPGFPLIEGEFFEYGDDGSFDIIINISGTFTHIKRNPSGFKDLITAINGLK